MDFSSMAGAGDMYSGLFGALGAFAGDLAGEQYRDNARDLMEQITRGYKNIDPTIQAALEDYVALGPSSYEDLGTRLDPATKDAQTRAYRALMERGLSGGMDAESRAALSEGLTESAQQESGARQALQQRFAAQGRGGSMAELAAQLSNTQSAAENNNRAATRAAGDASARAYQALAQGGALAGQARGQDYQQASDRASAMDTIAAHNARNRQGVNQRNADRTQSARAATIQNQFLRARGMADGLRGEAAGEMDRSRGIQQRLYGISSAAGQLAGMAGGGF